MTERTLQALSTEDLQAMKARVYRQLRGACQVSDLRQGPRVAASEIEAAFLRYDDELMARE